MDCIVHGVAKSKTGLSEFHFHFLKKILHGVCPLNNLNLKMQSVCIDCVIICQCLLHHISFSIYSIQICEVLSGGASQVAIGGKESACNARDLGLNPQVRKIPWRRKRQPTLVFLSEKFHGQRGLVGYHLWGRREWDLTENTHTPHVFFNAVLSCKYSMLSILLFPFLFILTACPLFCLNCFIS